MSGLSTTRNMTLRMALALAVAVIVALSWSAIAHAQSADDQYDEPLAPSGPAAGETATVQGDDDGVVGPGDVIIIPGDYVIAEGASVTLQDSDGTQGTLIDGQNAEIVEGSIVITVTDWPIINVPGANGVLNTEGLFVVATTGIAAAGDGAGDDGAASGGAVAEAGDATASAGGGSEAQPASAVVGVLPATGGPVLLGVLGGAALLGGGLLAVRRHLSNNEE